MTGLAGTPGALAGDRELLRAVTDLPAVQAAADGARGDAPDAVQRLYDRARDLMEALRAAAPVGASCEGLRRAAAGAARGHVLAAEGIDRLSPGDAARGRRLAAAGTRRVAEARRSCRPGAPGGAAVAPELLTPRSGEAFFGPIRARVPRGTAAAELRVDGRVVTRVDVRGPEVRLTSPVAAGRHDLRIVFEDDRGAVVGAAASDGVWALPASARVSRDGAIHDGALSRRLERQARGFPGFAGLWVQDLASGVTASHNADARFPAASTVKVALLMGALARVGPAPERSRDAYDLRAMAAWSSNLATNRILARRGGSIVAQRVMARVGASRSTFTGGYIVGTQLQPDLPGGGRTAEPPAVSSRVTTARDMARLLFALHAAAAGRPDALATTGLTLHQARVGLALLLGSEQRGDNRSLVTDGLPPGTPVAQKNGWLRRARHGAAIVYDPAGPRIVVILTYSDGGVSHDQAAQLGAAVAHLRVPGT